MTTPTFRSGRLSQRLLPLGLLTLWLAAPLHAQDSQALL